MEKNLENPFPTEPEINGTIELSDLRINIDGAHGVEPQPSDDDLPEFVKKHPTDFLGELEEHGRSLNLLIQALLHHGTNPDWLGIGSVHINLGLMAVKRAIFNSKGTTRP